MFGEKNLKKILLLSNMYPSKQFPHYGVFIQNTEKILEENNFEITKVVIPKTNKKMKKIYNYLKFFLVSTCLALFKKYDYVYIHYPSHSGIPILISNNLKKQNIVINIHGNDLIPETQKDELFIKNTLKLSKLSQKILVPSNYFRNELINKIPEIADKIIVFPSGGVNNETFFKVEKRVSKNKLCLDENKKYIGFVGRIEIAKGWDIFLKMVSEITDPNIEFIVVGNGSEENKFYEMVENLGIKNRILKYNLLSQKEINLVLNSLDIFVFPTYRRSESLGLVGLEAMGTNAILVAADNFGPTSYVEDKRNGFLFESKNVESLVSVIEEVLDLTEQEIAQIHDNAVLTLREYSQSIISSKLKSAFLEGNK